MRRHACSAGRMFLLLTIAGPLIGCAPQLDLQSVQKYAQATSDASVAFSSVAADYSAACDRLVEMELPPRLWTTPLVFPTPLPFGIPSAAPAQPEASVSSTVLTAPDWQRASAPPSCVVGQGVSVDWDKQNRVVLGYIQSLGAIAGVDVQPTLPPSLGNALVTGGILSQTQNSAASTLANQILAIVFTGEVQADLTKTVKEANAPLKDSIAALKVVNQSYGTLLSSEFDQTQLHYQRLIGNECSGALHAKTKPPAIDDSLIACRELKVTSPTLRALVFQQRQQLNNYLTAVNQKLAASANYAKVLDDIQSTHEQLFTAATEKPSLKDYLAILQKDVVPLYQDVEALKKGTP